MNSTWTMNFQMFKLDLEKAEEPEVKLATSIGSRKKQEIPEKQLLLLYWLCQNLWLCGSQQTVVNSERDGNTRPPYLPPEKYVCRSSSQQLELDMEQQTGSKSRKEYIKAAYCHCAYLTYIRVHHENCWVGWSTDRIKIAERSLNNLRYAEDTTLMA